MLRLSPDKFWPFSAALFEHQKEFFDVNVVKEARNDTYKRLAKVAGSVGLDEGKVYGLLEVSDKPNEDGSLNVGNQVTNDIKLMVKANRRTGVHVTPTVLLNVSHNALWTFVSLTMRLGYRGGQHLERLYRAAMGRMARQNYNLRQARRTCVGQALRLLALPFAIC